MTARETTATRLAAPRADLPGFTAPVVDDPELADTFRAVHRAAHQAAGVAETGVAPTEFETRLVRMFDRLLPHTGSATPIPRDGRDSAAAARDCAYVVDQLTGSASLDDLVTVTALSSFPAALGTCRGERHATLSLADHRPHLPNWVPSCDHATGLPVAEVATVNGFYHENRLHLHFRRLTGSTPSAYQEINRA